jgi:hypothetical protein
VELINDNRELIMYAAIISSATMGATASAVYKLKSEFQ